MSGISWPYKYFRTSVVVEAPKIADKEMGTFSIRIYFKIMEAYFRILYQYPSEFYYGVWIESDGWSAENGIIFMNNGMGSDDITTFLPGR